MKMPEFSALFRDKAPVHVETADFVVALKKDLRVEYRKKLLEAANSNQWIPVTPGPFANHMLFLVSNKAEVSEPKTAVEDDPFDLSGL